MCLTCRRTVAINCQVYVDCYLKNLSPFQNDEAKLAEMATGKKLVSNRKTTPSRAKPKSKTAPTSIKATVAAMTDADLRKSLQALGTVPFHRLPALTTPVLLRPCCPTAAASVFLRSRCLRWLGRGPRPLTIQ